MFFAVVTAATAAATATANVAAIAYCLLRYVATSWCVIVCKERTLYSQFL